MMRPWHICVLIPACNEEELLPRCLHSVFEACNKLPAEVTWDIIVAVDASTDGTLEIAEEIVSSHGEVIVTEAGMVGYARSAAAECAIRRYAGRLSLCWLAHTDADCLVPADWLVKQLRFADGDIEAVAGVISVDTFREHDPEVEARFHTSYLIEPDGSHPHVHGANLGVRADAYCRSGGWADLATAEDHDLWNRLGSAGCSRTSTATLRVTTSGRRFGRAPQGFADALAAHNQACA
jgi:glycosyltransferase involved in cell wall biosynthesis